MNAYRYNFVDDTGAEKATLVLNYATDDQACEIANDILSHSNFARVEVVRGAKTIFQAARDARGAFQSDGDGALPSRGENR